MKNLKPNSLKTQYLNKRFFNIIKNKRSYSTSDKVNENFTGKKRIDTVNLQHLKTIKSAVSMKNLKPNSLKTQYLQKKTLVEITLVKFLKYNPRVLYSRDIYQILGYDTKESSVRRCIGKLTKGKGIITIHHLSYKNCNRHAFYVHDSVLDSDFAKKHIFKRSGRYYIRGLKEIEIKKILSNLSTQDLFFKFTKKHNHSDYVMEAKTLIKTWYVNKTSQYSKKCTPSKDCLIKLKFYINSIVMFLQNNTKNKFSKKQKRIIYNLLFNSISSFRKKRQSFTLSSLKAMFLSITKNLDILIFESLELSIFTNFKKTMLKILQLFKKKPTFSSKIEKIENNQINGFFIPKDEYLMIGSFIKEFIPYVRQRRNEYTLKITSQNFENRILGKEEIKIVSLKIKIKLMKEKYQRMLLITKSVVTLKDESPYRRYKNGIQMFSY